MFLETEYSLNDNGVQAKLKNENALVIKTAIITLIAVLVAAEVLMFVYVKEFGVFYRPLTFVKEKTKVYFEPGDPNLDKVIKSSITGDWRRGELEELKKLVWPVVKEKKTDWEKAVALREWARSQAHKLGPLEFQDSLFDLLNNMNSGKGAQCGDFAELFMAASHSVGIPAREVVLLRNPPWDKYDTHVATELYIDGKWVFMDPTFDSHFLINGSLASAKDIQDYFLSPRENRPVLENIRGAREFHPTFGEYYLNPFSLFNNVVYVFDSGYKSSFIFKFPPFRHFQPHRKLVIQDENKSAFMLLNDIVFLYDIVIPVVVIGLVSILLIMYFSERRNKLNYRKFSKLTLQK